MDEHHEIVLSPQWKRTSSGPSLQSDGRSNGSLLLPSDDRELPLRRVSSSSSRNVSSNGSDRERGAYSNFYKNRRDRDRESNRGRDRLGDRDSLLDNGHNDCFEPLRRDPPKRSQPTVTGVRSPCLPKRPLSAISNGVASSSDGTGVHSSSVPKRPLSAISNGVAGSSDGTEVASVGCEFPSLGGRVKVGNSAAGSVSTQGASTAIQSLSHSFPNGWKSASVEPQDKVVNSGPQMTSVLQTAANTSSVLSSTSTGLSMAEKLAQAEPHVQAAPQIANDSERQKELTHYRKLIPKLQGQNSFDKLKSKAAKSSDYAAPKKIAHQPVVSHQVVLPAAKSDIPKVSQPTSFQILKRENGVHTTAAKDEPLSRTSSKDAAPSHFPKTALGPKPKASVEAGKKKPPSKSQERNKFFSGLRNNEKGKNSSSVDQETNYAESSSISSSSSDSNLQAHASDFSGVENGDNFDIKFPEKEELDFLRSLGWDEHAEVEPLTAEEIESFFTKYPHMRKRYHS